jgi:SpoVK/Ycf46/Vps4 family AAA+-type ATPase
VPDLPGLDLAVRNQLHDRLIRLGRRLDSVHEFADLVVDDETAAALYEIVAALRERRKVRERWGFRGSAGVSVLFSGDPGVGKTMSATVIARQLGLAIYEIDLSRVVSKWLGETEKNLGEVFDAAEPGHVVLLFNEADSLFGKRTTEVKSSNDRYANMETNYLLQRLERFGGLAILTTNLGGAVDPAFRRRFAYDVQFTFPDPEMRTELWRRAIPRTAEVGAIDYEELGERFELSGGFIKVAAERSAFQAAAMGEPMSTQGLVVTIHRMYRERGKLTAVGRLE